MPDKRTNEIERFSVVVWFETKQQSNQIKCVKKKKRA